MVDGCGVEGVGGFFPRVGGGSGGRADGGGEDGDGVGYAGGWWGVKYGLVQYLR